MAVADFRAQMLEKGVALAAKSIALYDADTLYLNGEEFKHANKTFAILKQLADQRFLTPSACSGLAGDRRLSANFYQWYQDAWLTLGDPT